MSEMDLTPQNNYSRPLTNNFDPKKGFLVRHIYFLELLKKIDQEFCQRKIPIWILKGPALIFRYYETAEQRSYTDLDIFVEPQNWEKSLQTLKDLGGKPLSGKKWMGNAFRAVYLFDNFPVEIHKGLLVERDLDYSFIKDSQPTKIPNLVWLREPCAEDLFVYLCGHGAFQHLYDEVQWLYDLNLLLIKEGASINWAKIFLRAKVYRLKNAVGVTLILLEKYFGHNVPNEEPLASWFLRKTAPHFLHPERIRKRLHQKPYIFYIIYKALMRDSFIEMLVYGFKRLFK